MSKNIQIFLIIVQIKNWLIRLENKTMKIAHLYKKIESIANVQHKIINKEMRILAFTIHRFY